MTISKSLRFKFSLSANKRSDLTRDNTSCNSYSFKHP